ncbi:PAS domain-containing protein [Shimia sp.]|uniref:PAS domain-containing protein n=1 Tax=Shimia sp. TaxID=1954381 RepID=UPI003296D403
MNEVTAYWEALRSGATIPYRSDVDPRGIQRALKNAFILERMAPGMARLRVAGQTLSELMGMEMRGMPVSALIDPDTREPFRRALEEVFLGPTTATLRLRSDGGYGKPALEAQMILLPLRGDAGKVTRILGALVHQGRVGRAPRRFHLEGSFLRKLDRQDEHKRLTHEAPELDYLDIKTIPTRHAHLRLVVTDD